MPRIGLYTDRDVFALGLGGAISPVHQLEILGLDKLLGPAPIALWDSGLNVLILDAPPEASHVIPQLRDVNPDVPVIVWERVVANEPALNALGSGVQGVLLDTSPPRDVLACIEAVLGGGIWVPASIAQAVVSSRLCKLTRRESQLVALVAQGLRNKEIAYGLGISEGTVKVYLSRLFEKLGVSDRYELALLALRHGGQSGSRAADRPAPQAMFIPRNNNRWTHGIQIT